MIRPVLCAVIYLLFWSGTLPAAAQTRSIGISYGPTDQVVFSLNWPRWGIYAQPILSYFDRDTHTELEIGARGGAYLAYTAFSYRQLECRITAGSGIHYARNTRTQKASDFSPGFEAEAEQQAGEFWLQPEFRFYGRFGILLQAQVLRYTWEEDSSDLGIQDAGFQTPDLSLSGLRIGFKYYLPFGH